MNQTDTNEIYENYVYFIQPNEMQVNGLKEEDFEYCEDCRQDNINSTVEYNSGTMIDEIIAKIGYTSMFAQKYHPNMKKEIAYKCVSKIDGVYSSIYDDHRVELKKYNTTNSCMFKDINMCKAYMDSNPRYNCIIECYVLEGLKEWIYEDYEFVKGTILAAAFKVLGEAAC